MRAAVPVVRVLAVAIALASAACSGTGVAPEAREVRVVENAPPVTGNVKLTMLTWNRNRGMEDVKPARVALVNASSEKGKRLLSGRDSSAEIATLDDLAMGRLLATLDEQGFASRARQGVTLDDYPDDGRRRGLMLLERDGRGWGLEYQPGSPDADVFRVCRNIVFQVHGAAAGYGVKVSTNADDNPERQFQAPRPRMQR